VGRNSANAFMMPSRRQFSVDVVDLMVIGNGIAGMTAALETVRLAPHLRVAVATDQGYPTVNKPAFKKYATGQISANQLLVYHKEQEWTRAIAAINGSVKYIEAEHHAVGFADNSWIGYRALVIATGSNAIELPASCPGRELDGVITLHHLEDYYELRRRMSEVRRAVVIGGGIQAMETALGLVHQGIRVFWLIRSTFMSGLLDAAASKLALSHVREPGLSIATHTGITAILGRAGRVAAVITNDGKQLPCELVLPCIGTAPEITLANRSTIPLQTQNGIIVDDALRTNAPDIYAIGDVASIRHPQKDSYEPRRTWSEAALQGHMVASYLSGQSRGSAGLGVPWNSTRIGEQWLQTVGDALTERHDCATYIYAKQGYRRIVMKGKRLIGYLYLGNTPTDSQAIKRIIDEGIPIASVHPLLYSHFDARAYLMQWQSRQIRGHLR